MKQNNMIGLKGKENAEAHGAGLSSQVIVASAFISNLNRIITLVPVSLDMKQKVFSFLLFLLMLGKVSALHMYSHMLMADDDCVEHCEHCEQAVLDSFTPALTTPEPSQVQTPHVIVLNVGITNFYYQPFLSKKHLGQFYNKPPPSYC